jgi:hypothetical protein
MAVIFGDPGLSLTPWFYALSAAFALGAAVLLVLRFRKEATLLVVCAIAAPTVGRLADIFAALAIYVAGLLLITGMIAAWYFIRLKFNVPDDGTVFTKPKLNLD